MGSGGVLNKQGGKRGVMVQKYREIRENGELVLHMHEGQVRAWNSRAREIVMLAGTQGGKTSFAVDWLQREIRRRGEGDYLCVTATYPLLSLKLLPEFLEVFERVCKLGEYRASDRVFEFRGGKTKVFFGTATNSESLESATAKGAIADEAGQRQFRRESREALLRRLAIHRGRILYPTTPYGLGWLKSELVDKAVGGVGDIEVISFPSVMNPVFPKEEAERAKRVLPGWKYRMFYEGKFERPVGLVYDSFDGVVCRIPRIPVPKEWPRYVGHDFGLANPAALFYAVDPTTGYIYAYDEYLPGRKSIAEHVGEWKKRTSGLTVIARVGGNQVTEEETRQAYTAHGWAIQKPRVGSVQAQVERVYALHKTNRVFIFDDLSNYLDELESFSYKLDDKYEVTDEYDGESSYHLLACARYILSDFTPEVAEVKDYPVVSRVFSSKGRLWSPRGSSRRAYR